MSDKNENKQIDPHIVEEDGDDEGHYIEVIDLDAELDQDGNFYCNDFHKHTLNYLYYQ